MGFFFFIMYKYNKNNNTQNLIHSLYLFHMNDFKLLVDWMVKKMKKKGVAYVFSYSFCLDLVWGVELWDPTCRGCIDFTGVTRNINKLQLSPVESHDKTFFKIFIHTASSFCICSTFISPDCFVWKAQRPDGLTFCLFFLFCLCSTSGGTYRGITKAKQVKCAKLI